MSTDKQDSGNTATLPKPKQSIEAPFQQFILEIGDCASEGPVESRRNRGILLVNIRQKLRGRFSFGNQRGKTFGRLSGMPDVPGMFIEVKPNGRRVRIFDPLEPKENAPGEEDYESILQDMNSIIKKAVGGTFKVEESSHPITGEHQFKTLVRELIEWNDAGNIYKLHVGQMPTCDQVDKLPGKYMCNHYHSGQVPKFEDEWHAYLDNLMRVGMI